MLDDMDAVAVLRERVEMAKRTLTTVASTNVPFGWHALPGQVSCSNFENVSRSLLNRPRELVEDVLDAGGIGWKQVDHVLLVGGSMRMPMVRSMVENLSGKKHATDINPDEVVALGAAIQAAIEQTKYAAEQTKYAAGGSGRNRVVPSVPSRRDRPRSEAGQYRSAT